MDAISLSASESSIIIDKTFVERKNHWPYPDKSWLEEVVLTLCHQLTDPRCVASREIFIRDNDDECRWKPPRILLQKSPGILSQTTGWFRIRNFRYYEKVRLIYSGVYGGPSKCQTIFGDMYEHGSFMPGEGVNQWDFHQRPRIGVCDDDEKNRMETNIVIPKEKRHDDIASMTPMEKAWGRVTTTWQEFLEKHTRIMIERVKLLDLCDQFLRDVELVLDTRTPEWLAIEREEFDIVKERLMVAGNTFID